MGSYISGVISRVTILIAHMGGLITPFRTTHEPPSRVQVKLPLAPKTDLSKDLYIETIIRNPKKVGFSGHR